MNLEFGFGYATVRYLARASAAGDATAESAVADTSYAVFAAAALLGGCTLAGLARLLVRNVFSVPGPLVSNAQTAFILCVLHDVRPLSDDAGEGATGRA
jgi:hypothetical protein